MRKCLKLLFGLVLLLSLADSTLAQGALYSNIAWRYTPAGAFPASGAIITICTSTATGTPCSPTLTVYQDVLLSVPVVLVNGGLPVCSTSPQIGCLDGLGNFSFYMTPGPFTYTVTGAGLRAYGPIPGATPCTAGVTCPATSSPNTWSALQTFTAGLTVSSGLATFGGGLTLPPTASGIHPSQTLTLTSNTTLGPESATMILDSLGDLQITASEPNGDVVITPGTGGASYVFAFNASANANVTQTIVGGTQALNTASITTATCDAGVAATATGAVSTDRVNWSFASPVTTASKYGAFLVVYAVPSLNTVTFYTCNPSATTSTPTAMSVNWSVVR